MTPASTTPLDKRIKIVIDFETSGVPRHLAHAGVHGSDHACPIQIGAVAMAPTGNIISRFEALIAPNTDEEQTFLFSEAALPALMVNGMDPAFIVQYGLTPETAAYGFLSWYLGFEHTYQYNPAIYAFNLAFDQYFLAMLTKHIHRDGPFWPFGPCIQRMVSEHLDTEQISLRAACVQVGVRYKMPDHSALNDSISAARLLHRLEVKNA
jgi:DNA polymerase III epsilon subunit-like protein